MNRTTLALSAALALALVVGCGGGGGGASSSGSTSSTTTGTSGTTYVPAQTSLAALSATQVFTYNISGSYTPSGSTTPKTIASGVRNEEVNSGSSSSNLLLTTSDGVSFTDGTSSAFVFNSFVTQSSDRSVLLQSVELPSGTKTIVTPDAILPGTFALNETLTKTLAYAQGGSATVSFAVQSATANVTVPFGSYVTYPVVATFDYGEGVSRSGTYYYVPQLGTYIKAVETVTTPTASETVTAVLTSSARP